MKKTLATALSLISLNSMALGQLPTDFKFGSGTELTCLIGPGILTLKFGEISDNSGFNEQKYNVSGVGLTNTFGLQSKKFKGTLLVKQVSTRAYYGQEIVGELPELNGEVRLQNHRWYSYVNHDLPIHFTGHFESFERNQAYQLICFPAN